MDLEKLSKAELILKVNELLKTIEDLGHLKSAVDAKDKDIIGLTKNIQIFERDSNELKSLRSSFAQLNITLENKNHEFNKLKADYDAYKRTAPSLEVLENLKKDVKVLEERNKALTDFLNPYVMNVRSVLKGIQGTLELGIENEALLSEKINKK